MGPLYDLIMMLPPWRVRLDVILAGIMIIGGLIIAHPRD